jgi:hypothetical protein
MSWLPQSEFDRLKKAALALTREEREVLTWEAAWAFVAADTLDIAQWAGLMKSGLTPWECVVRLRRLDQDEEAL